MAGIGDYIHAHKITYLTYSTTQRTLISPPKPYQIYNTQIAQMKQEMARKKFSQTKKERDKLEKMLNLFFNPRNRTNINRGELNTKDVENIEKATRMYIEQKFGKEVYLNPNTLSITSKIDVANLNDEQTDFLNKIKELKNFNAASSRSIQGLIKGYEAFKKFRESIGDNSKQLVSADLYQRLLKLEKSYEEFINIKNAYVAKTGNTKMISGYRLYRKHDMNLDEELDSLIREIKLTTAVNAQGRYAEVILKATNYVVNHKGRSSVNQILSYLLDPKNAPTKSRKGVNKNNISFYASYYADESLLYNAQKKPINYQDLQDDVFTINVTEDKVDATLYLKSFENVNVSIKNYNLSNIDYYSHLQLLKGKNLLGLVQDYHDFVNHFLNIVGSHVDNNFDNFSIYVMHQAMKITAFVKAISGGVYTNKGYSDKVDLFVVNDNSKGGYKVYYLSELLDKVIGNIELLNFSKYPNGIWTENDWITAVTTENSKISPDRRAVAIRITRLVNKMRTMQLDISISPKALI